MKNLRRYFRCYLSMFAALLAFSADIAFACPTCKDAITEQYVAAYGASIVFMMSMPFLILGSLSAYFYYEVLKARRLQQANLAVAREVIANDQGMPTASS